jgi:hypothetical protein
MAYHKPKGNTLNDFSCPARFFFLRGQLSSKVGGNVKNHINRFVLKIIFIKIYIYNFPIKTFKKSKVVLW